MAKHISPAVKPRLRGVSHQAFGPFAFLAGTWLMNSAPDGQPRLAALIYTLCITALFVISAAYHRPQWQPAARQRMRRLDHAAIFLMIAGTYTPVCLITLRGDAGNQLLYVIWGGAIAGILVKLFWLHAPKPLSAALYVLLGWAVVVQWQAVSAGLGAAGVQLMLSGGILYTLGALIYARRRPDPWPQTFGYHEIFHALVIAAAACHFVMVARVILQIG